MPVGPNSRYQARTAAIYTDADGRERVALPARWDPSTPSDVAYHQVTEGDTFETLAKRYLGSSQLWWQIADVNPLMFPLDLTPGTSVLVPIGGARSGSSRTRNW